MSNNISGKEKLEMQLSRKQEIDMNFDKTFFCKILKNSTGVSETLTEAEKATLTDCDEFYYYVKIYGKFYKIKSADSDFTIDEDVRVKIPNNNWDRMYIDFRKAIEINPVTELTAILNSDIVTLNWKNPKGSFDGIIILRKTGSDFIDDFDGNIIYQGKLETFNDTLPLANINYYYKAVSYKNTDIYNANCQSVLVQAIDDTKRYLFFGTINTQYGDGRVVDDNNIEEARNNAMYNNYVSIQVYGFNLCNNPLNSNSINNFNGRIISANIQLVFNSSTQQIDNMYCYCQNSIGINTFTISPFSKIKIRGYCQYFTLHTLGHDAWNTYEYHNKIKLFFNIYSYNSSNNSLNFISGIDSINNPSLFVGKVGSFTPQQTNDLDEFELSISYDNTKFYYIRAGIEKYEQNYGGLFVITKIWVE